MLIHPPDDPRLRRLRGLGHLLDASIRIPGTRRRFGLDPLIGLLPGVGDGVGAVLSSYIIVEAARYGVPRATLLRMAGNVAIDALVGVVPLLGDLFDAGWKANLRNLALLEDHLQSPGTARRASRRWVGGIVGGLLLLLFGIAVLAVWLGAAVLRALGLL
ncbi:hypothetical protein BH20GEM2_BH20GEM2_02090 [soil metagenome]|nr:DUF4112 domain-containing protein [Gemmatimonadota bacterium]